MKLLVCGGRDYQDGETVLLSILYLHRRKSITLLMHGGARGADALAGAAAQKLGIPTRAYPADWHKHGAAAGVIRNQIMLTAGKPDMVLAFPGGRGTADMVRRARRAKVEVVKIG